MEYLLKKTTMFIITESEKKLLTIKGFEKEALNKVTSIWESFSMGEKLFVIEFLKITQPHNVKILTEATWYNTIADIIGIFDPTGVVDIMNGISYWRQGDKLYALLSWISAIPGLGDIIAKPIIGALKMGSPATKAFKAAVESGNAAKVAETATKAGKAAVKFVKESITWGDRIVYALRKTIGRIPIGLPFLAGGSRLSGKGFVNVVEEWVNMFKSSSKMFKGYKPATKTFGVPKLFGNRHVSSLMTRTKAYLGFLDYLGIGNWDNDPEDFENLKKQYPKEWEEYQQTDKYKQEKEEDETMSAPPGVSSSHWEKIKPKSSGIDMSSEIANPNFNPIIALIKAFV